MNTQTKTFETLRQLKDGLPSLPDDAVIRDSDGDEVPRRDIPMMSGSYSPYAVTYEVPTPAPLDPAKVKAGDTVTLENGDTSVRGPVVTVEKALPTDVTLGFAIKNVGWRYLAPGVVAQQDDGVWTLTDHQPAPEPEPEWLPGDVAVVETEGAYPGGPRRAVRRGGVWHSLDMEGYAIDGNVTSVRPLVVIDPADVDWAALHNALAAGGVGNARDAVNILLHELGIEHTS